MTEVDLIGHQARSKEGRGLSLRGGDSDKWITIQKNTFTNWINVQLQPAGLAVTDLQEDFCDGVRLCALVEALQEKKIGKIIKKPMNQHQYLENVQIALNAIAADNVRLVNIGSEDIVRSSLKLILGLVWHLILRYQIGKTKFPPKKLMLAWLHAVIPECRISNFTTDWNDGVSLHALIEYCRPGLCPNWHQLSRQNRLENCSEAMNMAKENFDIPLILRPEDLASPHLDDLSGMTYLSYYMNIDSPGYCATLRNVKKLLKPGHPPLENFTTDWNDGRVLHHVVKSVGGNPPPLTNDHVENLQNGIDAGRRLDVEPIFTAQEMSDPEVEHLGIMAYAAYFTRMTPVKSRADKAYIDGDFNSVYVKQDKNFRLNIDDDVSPEDFTAEVIGPDSLPPVDLKWSGRSAVCSFTPVETGQHWLNIYHVENSNSKEPIAGCPVSIKVSSDRSKVNFHPLERCLVGVVADLKVDTSAAGQGDVQLEARTPSGRSLNLPVTYRSGVYSANFTPSEVGDHHISVAYDGDHINGSPFVVRAYDPSLVRIYGLEGGSVGQELSFNADTSKAGEGDLRVAVSHDDEEIPCYATQEASGLHKINFTPQGAGLYKINAFFNEQEVRGSPFEQEISESSMTTGSPYTLDIVDSSMVTVSGAGLSLVPVNQPAVFNVHTLGAGGGNVNVDITSPSGQNVPCDIKKEDSDELLYEYTPQEVGEHNIHVSYGPNEVSGSPFVAKAYDISAISLTPLPLHDGFVSKPVKFSIDVRSAGEGQLQIMVNNGNLPNEVSMVETGVYDISFIPEEPGVQKVDIIFNDEAIPKSPFTCNAIDLSASITDLPEIQPVGRESCFLIRSQATAESNISADVTIHSPSGQQIPAKISASGAETFRVEYTPREIGTHVVKTSLAGVPLKGSPFRVKVFDARLIKVSKIPQGVVGIPCRFIVDASTAGEGTLEIAISANGCNIPNQARALGGGRFEVSFVGRQAVMHEAVITYNKLHVQGSPFSIVFLDASQITAKGEGLGHVSCHRQTHFIIHTPGAALPDLNVRITAPDGQNVPVRIRDRGDQTYRVEWMPTTVGDHKALIEYAEMQIRGSPFAVKTFDAINVKVSHIDHGFLGRPVSFTVDPSKAGDGNIEIQVTAEGQSVPNYVQQKKDNTFCVTFTPEYSSTHQVHVGFNGEPVSGSPFMCKILESDCITTSGSGLKMIPTNVLATFKVKPQGAGDMDLNVRVFSPGGCDVPAQISGSSRSAFSVDYMPSEIGLYRIHVKYGGVVVKGSPFSCIVYNPSDIHVTNPHHGYVGKPVHFQIDASAVGYGSLAAEVKCRGRNVSNDTKETGLGQYEMSFTPQDLTLHIVEILFNQFPLPGSPYHIDVSDGNSVSVCKESLRRSRIFQETWVSLDLNGMDERNLDIHIISPSGCEVPYQLKQRGHVCWAEFTPVEAGAHKISVCIAGTILQGSPFIRHIYDPSLVRITDIQRSAKKKREIGFIVDMSAAGLGNLETCVTHHGHSIHTHRETISDSCFRYTFTPTEVGRYNVNVQFNDEPVPDSPVGIIVEEDVPTFFTINLHGTKAVNVGHKNCFTLQMDGKKN